MRLILGKRGKDFRLFALLPEPQDADRCPHRPVQSVTLLCLRVGLTPSDNLRQPTTLTTERSVSRFKELAVGGASMRVTLGLSRWGASTHSGQPRASTRAHTHCWLLRLHERPAIREAVFGRCTTLIARFAPYRL
jgi:hypothetical protein